MQKTCTHCQASFQITDDDLAFYDEISPVIGVEKFTIPPPTFCADCRQQRRLSWRNERVLYRNTCAATEKVQYTPFSTDKPFIIYENSYWNSDTWNPLDYGRDFDFSRPFFPQFRELMEAVPHIARSATGNQNCDYSNQIGWCKDCYLVFEASNNEECLYGNYVTHCKICCDILQTHECQQCYECIACRRCYNAKYSLNCENCTDCWMLKDCIGCKKCVGCINLRNKEYYIFNEPYSPEDYQKKLSELRLTERSHIESLWNTFQEFILQHPHRAYQGTQNEDATGDYIWKMQRCHECFDVQESQDCKRVYNSQHCKKVHDMSVYGAEKGVEFCYENHEIGDGCRNLLFCDQMWGASHDLLYCKLCPVECHNLFGCVSMKRSNYCILNKQYSKEEYEVQVSKIIRHMQNTGEWGEFFPAHLSPFAYNETIALQHYPLTEEEAIAKGYAWKKNIDEPLKVEKVISGSKLPESIDAVPDDILNWAIECPATKRPFRILKQELNFYRDHALPIPMFHSDVRHVKRMKIRNPFTLHKRKCMKCQKDIQTTYAPDRPEIVYCEECYLREVY